MDASYRHTVDDVVAIAEHEWRQHGVDRRDRTELATDLRMELEAAAAEGVTPDRLIGPGVRTFARRLAEEAGARRVPYEFRELVATTLAGAAVMGFVAYLGLGRLLYLPFDRVMPDSAAAAVYWATLVSLMLAGALLAVRWRMRDVPRIGATVARMAVLLPAAGLASAPVAVAYGAVFDYSGHAFVVVGEAAVVGAALAGATVLARRWALREPRTAKP